MNRVTIILHEVSITPLPDLPAPSPAPISWRDILKQQPEWVYRLLDHMYDDDMNHVVDQIHASRLLFIVSDGSAKFGMMTFGWVLCTNEGSRLVKCHGSCPGRPSSLLRGEACGMLAATLFATILKQHLGCTFDSMFLSYQSDNMELIKRQQDHQSYTYPYPNTTLTAEFDLTKMIRVLHKDPTHCCQNFTM